MGREADVDPRDWLASCTRVKHHVVLPHPGQERGQVLWLHGYVSEPSSGLPSPAETQILTERNHTVC